MDLIEAIDNILNAKNAKDYSIVLLLAGCILNDVKLPDHANQSQRLRASALAPFLQALVARDSAFVDGDMETIAELKAAVRLAVEHGYGRHLARIERLAGAVN